MKKYSSHIRRDFTQSYYFMVPGKIRHDECQTRDK